VATIAWIHPTRARGRASARFSAVAFDGFPIFDPRAVTRVAEELFSGRGGDLVTAWRMRQFEYQWLRALGGHYADFWATTSDGLTFAASQQRLDLTPQARERLMSVFLALPVWPDVKPALRELQEAGVRLAILSNMTPGMLDAGIREAGLTGVFEHVLSTDRLKTYKPDPRAYAMGVEALGLAREKILFAAFAGWDVAGAKWFGYPTYWVNRLGQPVEALNAPPDGSGPGLTDLVEFVTRRG
jgi:2-haloacid dehalogenase